LGNSNIEIGLFFDNGNPLCLCGCGNHVSWDKSHKQWYQYISGHRPAPLDCITSEAPLCACGCGLHTYKGKNGHWRHYRSGHKNPKIPTEDPPECACGCHLLVTWNKWRQKWHTYLNGHRQQCERNKKISDRSTVRLLCLCGCGLYVTKQQNGDWKNYISGHKNAKLPDSPPPNCACGCGDSVTWNKRTHKWNKYLKDHHKHTEFFRKRASDRNKRRYEAADARALMSLSLKQSYLFTPDRRQRVSDGLKKAHIADPEIRKRIGKSIRQRYKDPEYRKMMGAAIKKAFADNPEIRKKISIANKRNWERAEYVGNVFAGWRNSPNIPESLLLALTPDQVIYVGNGKFWRTLKIRTNDGFITRHKNPDFLVVGQRKVIEYNGMPWHKNDYPDEVWHEAWGRIGYKLLIIWDYELKESVDKVLDRIAEFIGQDEWQLNLTM